MTWRRTLHRSPCWMIMLRGTLTVFLKHLVFDSSVAPLLCSRFPKILGESGNDMIWDDHSSSKVVFIKGFFNESLPDLHDRLRADGSGLAWFGVLAKLFLGASHHQTIKLYHYAMNQKQKNTETIPNKERKTLGSFAESSQKDTKDPAHVGPAAANGLLWRSHTWISCNYVRLHHSKRSQGRIALLHLDADLYSSYLDTLFNLYDLLEIGSFVICDDCGYIEEAGRAVTDFRILHGIDALQQLSDSELTRYWQKTAEVEIDWSPLLTWLHCFSFDTRFGQSHRSINLLWLWVAVIAHFVDLDVFWAT